LPTAFAQIPMAVADVTTGGSSGTRADGLRLLNQHPDLVGLARVAENPSPMVTPLTMGLAAADAVGRNPRFPSVRRLLVLFGVPGLMAVLAGAVVLGCGLRRGPLRAAQGGCVLAAVWLVVAAVAPVSPGRPSLVGEARASVDASHRVQSVAGPAAVQSLQTDLALLQNIYADVVPAVQAAATSSGHTLTNAQAGRIIMADPRLVELQRFVTGLSALYGAGVLAVQASAANQGVAQMTGPLLVLPAVAIILALALVALAWVTPVRSGRIHRPPEVAAALT
jgi:hypothetical protein